MHERLLNHEFQKNKNEKALIELNKHFWLLYCWIIAQLFAILTCLSEYVQFFSYFDISKILALLFFFDIRLFWKVAVAVYCCALSCKKHLIRLCKIRNNSQKTSFLKKFIEYSFQRFSCIKLCNIYDYISKVSITSIYSWYIKFRKLFI